MRLSQQTELQDMLYVTGDLKMAVDCIEAEAKRRGMKINHWEITITATDEALKK